MEYQKALEIVTNNQHLIGKSMKDGIIDDLVIYPTGVNYEDFIKSYIQTRNSNASIQPYKNYDVNVFAVVDAGRINSQGLFLHASLENISQEHQVFI